ncbi:MAG: endopeptidase La [Bacteroidales bacterium]|nr:endopeptidase La [Bacteroidales bacterium]
MNILSDNIFLSGIINDEPEFIPLLSAEDEESLNKENIPEFLPLLPLRNTVLFPGVVIPITVGRDKSIKLIREAYKQKKVIGVVAQKNVEIEDPAPEDLNRIGTLAYIIKVLQMPEGSTTVIIQGRKRIEVEAVVETDPFFKAKVKPFDIEIEIPKDDDFQALINSLKDLSIQIIKASPNIPSEASFAIKNIESPAFLVNFVSSNLNIEIGEKQKLIEINNLRERATIVLSYLTKELQVIQLKNQIQDKVKVDLDKQQRDFILQQQLKTIQEELGMNSHQQEIIDLQAKAKNKKWSKEAAEKYEKELVKLQRMNSAAAEYSIQVNYLDTLVELPWNELTVDNFDLVAAKKILDEDHFGLDKIKDRIIEHLAVYKLKGDMKSPILCLVGPPGVGKTSLGKSIARSLGRKYIRMSLGGIRDEAELRGHRKTYIGAMPGRILQNLKKVKSSNPVFVLDEIDKVIGYNVQGDPQAALLEILDPEQNSAFYDNFLEMDYDLSKVMFIATANTLATMHQALRDRLEIIDINGYLVEEKIKIAINHLIPKQLAENGVTDKQIIFSEKIIETLIENYTRESGVRTLEKLIAKVIRGNVRYIVNGEKYNKKINEEDLKKILGIPKFQYEKELNNDVPGVVTGLAWTAVGGEILFIEVSLSKGKGTLTLTGNLGDVMKESATIAFEYLKAHSLKLDISPDIFEKWNVHIHVPEGATPKDGPSAGITMFTALASAFTRRKVKQKLAMTGEITLRGKVLPVGGITEKILAAKRAKITDIILSEENRKDIEDIKKDYIKGLKFHYIRDMIDITGIALLKEKADNLNFN